ncbi:hypothetical protein FJD38_22680 [Pseudomonas saxonica]|uniref:DUF3077 domain-containing protein n=1 Tax=Pseudomonas saxonica TaxID=2600598 RepID=A0ABY3GC88_9PSED|nr:hypothetical protein [Pseudomonas saxonica]TWR85091.1 hypothetical protein FJD38_22680 [Pseudomonas saxonica]
MTIGEQVLNASTMYGHGETERRTYAVAAALEVITALAASGSSVNLESEMKSLSNYADLIQEALKAK